MQPILRRLIAFQRQLLKLWQAFMHPATPLYLKAIMVAVVVYLVSPIDLIPDFLLVLGLVDDVLLVALAVNWILSRLPPEVFGEPARASANAPTPERPYDETAGPIINGTAKRL